MNAAEEALHAATTSSSVPCHRPLPLTPLSNQSRAIRLATLPLAHTVCNLDWHAAHSLPLYFFRVSGLTLAEAKRLAGATLELLAEHEQLRLVVDGQHTGTGDTTENVGTSTLEERAHTLLSNDLLRGVDGRLVLDGLNTSLSMQSQLSYFTFPSHLPRQTSSSCDDGSCRAGRRRYRHQWSQSSRARRRPRSYPRAGRRGRRA